MFLTTLQASLPRHAHTLSQRTLLAIALAALVASALYWLPADLSIGARLALATFAIRIVAATPDLRGWNAEMSLAANSGVSRRVATAVRCQLNG